MNGEKLPVIGYSILTRNFQSSNSVISIQGLDAVCVYRYRLICQIRITRTQAMNDENEHEHKHEHEHEHQRECEHEHECGHEHEHENEHELKD